MDPVLVEFPAFIPGLVADRFDAGVGMLFIRPDRCEEVLFSDPLLCAFEAFAVAEGNPYNISRFEDVARNENIRLGIVGGSAEALYAEAAGVSMNQIVVFDDIVTATEAVGAGRADAFAYDVIAIRYTVESTGTAAAVTEPFQMVIDGEPQHGCVGFMFRKADADLRDAFNEEQRKLMESGEARQLVETFTGEVSAGIETAQELSAEELCAG